MTITSIIDDTSLIEEAITFHFGERCPDMDPDCRCCRAWKALDAVMAERERDQWRDISTAPKDGSQVLLRGGDVDTVWYDENAVKPECVVSWYEGTSDWPVWRFCSFDGGTYGEYVEPTHWMPLPQLPK